MDQPDEMNCSGPYLSGGPGMLFSHALMKYMHSRWMQCAPFDDEDSLVGYCLRQHGLSAMRINEKAFWCERFKPAWSDQLRNMTKEEVLKRAGPRIAFHAIYNLDEAQTLYRNFYNAV